jgi:hypothetical protein
MAEGGIEVSVTQLRPFFSWRRKAGSEAQVHFVYPVFGG